MHCIFYLLNHCCGTRYVIALLNSLCVIENPWVHDTRIGNLRNASNHINIRSGSKFSTNSQSVIFTFSLYTHGLNGNFNMSCLSARLFALHANSTHPPLLFSLYS